MPRVNRPSAVDIDESDNDDQLPIPSGPSVNPLSTSLAKRQNDYDISTGRTRKQSRSDYRNRRPAYYKTPEGSYDAPETDIPFLPGENFELPANGKRIRLLDEFDIIATENEELTSLNDMVLGLEAVGFVTAYDDNSEDASEDAGQDDDIQELLRIRTTQIEKVDRLDPGSAGDVRIETTHAVYILRKPSKAYFHMFHVYLDPETAERVSVRPTPPAAPRHVQLEFDTRWIDDDVLKPEHQTRTQVTPFVYREAQDFYNERFVIVGERLKEPAFIDDSERNRRELLACVEQARKPPANRRVRYPGGRLRGAERKRQPFTVDGVPYAVGDVVLLQNPLATIPQDLPPQARIEDYFLFAEILFTDIDSQRAHVMYFQHGSLTGFNIEPISDPRELFLTTHCCEVENEPDFNQICGKVAVTKLTGADIIPSKISTLYFSRFLFHDTIPSFVDHPKAPVATVAPSCPTCEWIEENYSEPTLKTRGIPTLHTRGTDFHINDYALFTNTPQIGNLEVGLIGRIRKLPENPKRLETVDVVLLERQVDHGENLPDGEILDEHELLDTDRVFKVPIEHIIRKVHVRDADSLDDPAAWTVRSPDHFIVRWYFPRTKEIRWDHKLPVAEVPQCGICMQAKQEDDARREQFARESEKLRVLDVFSGPGSFSLSMIEAMFGLMELKGAIEISPSAAASLKKYSPDTTVYNQCANPMLAYMVRSAANKPFDPEKDIRTNLDGTPLAPAPRKGEIDVVVAGFPCQPHSLLNRFQRADDRKSNLILTALSFIDFLQPKYAFFENVPGFLEYNIEHKKHKKPLNARSTGLRFLVNVLLKMGYQLRIGLLNAANFGSPQRRKRFFLVAAQSGMPFPRMPYPTHFFSDPHMFSSFLSIRMSKGLPPARPIHPEPGTFLFKHITAQDAISDLRAFDSRNSGTRARALNIQLPDRTRGDQVLLDIRGPNVPAVSPPADDEEKFLRCEMSGYAHAPRTTYQARARKIEPGDAELQHYAVVLPTASVELLCNVPMKKGADFRDLPRGLLSWGLHDPTSASSRNAFRFPFFGRIDYDGVFHAVVVNFGPTAKQSKVLHPWCHRPVTVRELARAQGFPDSYEFISLSGNVRLMLRQIGNAVAWPVGNAIGRELFEALYQRWLERRGD